MIKLKQLNDIDVEKEFSFFQQLKSENGFENPYESVTFDIFKNKIIPNRLAIANGKELEAGHVPDTYFLLWDNQCIIGIFKVRHYLNDSLKNGAGHIGYSILREFRGKGYGKLGLSLAIKELIQLPDFKESEIFFSCHKDNLASLKTILSNGGYIHHEDDENYYVRIIAPKK